MASGGTARLEVVPQRSQVGGVEQLPNFEARVLVGVPRGQAAIVIPAEPTPSIELGITQLAKKKVRQMFSFVK